MNVRTLPAVIADQLASKTTNPDRNAPPLLCLSHLRWDFVWQRPQHLMSRAAAHYKVVYFEEPLFEAVLAPELRLQLRSPVTVATPILPEAMAGTDTTAAVRRLLDDLVAAEPVPERVFWYYTPMALAFSRHIVPDLCVYDNMDELSAFRNAPRNLIELEKELFQRADLVFTGGQSLYESKQKRHEAVYCFPSSVDAAHFHRARTAQPDPADQKDIAHPRLGFFGVVDERMDINLVRETAGLRPDWQFVMIGPVVKIDESSLPRLPNIHWLGGKDYRDLPRYLSGWDVGFMPFALNESTRFISPTKTPEFLAAGLPVISTPIFDVVRPYGDKGLVSIVRDAGEAVRACERILVTGRDERWLRRVDRHLAAMSWDKTWGAMQKLMQTELGEDSLSVAEESRPSVSRTSTESRTSAASVE